MIIVYLLKWCQLSGTVPDNWLNKPLTEGYSITLEITVAIGSKMF